MSRSITDAAIAEVLASVPDALLAGASRSAEFASADDARARYRDYLLTRLQSPRAFVAEAIGAREQLVREPPRRLSARR
jgi:hypothetical protein